MKNLILPHWEALVSLFFLACVQDVWIRYGARKKGFALLVKCLCRKRITIWIMKMYCGKNSTDICRFLGQWPCLIFKNTER